MRAFPRLVPFLIAATTSAVLSGCGGGAEGAEATASSTSAATSSTTSASGVSSEDPSTDGGAAAPDDGGAAPFPANTDPDTAEPSGDALVSITDVRVGRHEGFDRVVFETGGTGTPGWDVRYVEEAASQGSGDPVAVGGGAVLQVTLTGVGYPFDTGVEEYPVGGAVPGPGAGTVAEVVFDGTFEGQSVAFVGTTARTPFRVYLLEEPARVVVEVADQG